jgi:hypothetical protein
MPFGNGGMVFTSDETSKVNEAVLPFGFAGVPDPSLCSIQSADSLRGDLESRLVEASLGVYPRPQKISILDMPRWHTGMSLSLREVK